MCFGGELNLNLKAPLYFEVNLVIAEGAEIGFEWYGSRVL